MYIIKKWKEMKEVIFKIKAFFINNIQTRMQTLNQFNLPTLPFLFKIGYILKNQQKTKATGIIKHKSQQSRKCKKKYKIINMFK